MRDLAIKCLIAAVIAFPVGAICFAIHHRGEEYKCEDRCHEQHHNFSLINTAGECVCGDEAE